MDPIKKTKLPSMPSRKFLYCLILLVCTRSCFSVRAPPRVPHETDPPNYHMKEDSIVNCSRSVSRWTYKAWREFLNTLQGGFLEDMIDVNCPINTLRPPTYIEDDKLKLTRNNAFVCSLCSRKYSTEYEFDVHMDKYHLFSPYILPDTYSNAPVLEVLNTHTENNESLSLVDLTNHVDSKGFVCLEKYCQIFDTCDRSPSMSTWLIPNDLSIAAEYNEPSIPKNKNGPSSCNVPELYSARQMCLDLVKQCFPPESSFYPVKAAYVHAKLVLCGALTNCERYMVRRQYAGTRFHYTEAGYLGVSIGIFTLMEGWQVAILIVVGLIILAVCVMFFFIYKDIKAAREEDSSFPEQSTHAYKSETAKGKDYYMRRRYGGDPYLYGKLSTDETTHPSPASTQTSGSPYGQDFLLTHHHMF